MKNGQFGAYEQYKFKKNYVNSSHKTVICLLFVMERIKLCPGIEQYFVAQDIRKPNQQTNKQHVLKGKTWQILQPKVTTF